MILEHQLFTLCGKRVLERIIFEPPFTHWNSMDQEACFLYSRIGESNVLHGSDRTSLKEKEGLLMQCGNYIHHFKPSQKPIAYEAIALHFHPEVLHFIYKEEIPEFLKEQGNSLTMVEKIKMEGVMAHYIEGLQIYLDSPGVLSEEMIGIKVKELILLLLNTDPSGQIRQLLQGMFVPKEINFKKTIDAHLYEPLGIDALAMLTNKSTSSFKRKFKEVYATSPAKYIKAKRLEKAAKMIKTTNNSISEIAYACGFNALGHFSKSFVQSYGCSPSAYRNAVV